MSDFTTKEAGRPRNAGSWKRVGLAGIAALMVTGASVAVTAPAQARDWHHYHHGNGGAVAAGVLGGLALGAVVGSTYAAPAPTVIYEDRYPDDGYERVYERRLPSCSDFRRVDWRRRLWIDDYGRGHPCY